MKKILIKYKNVIENKTLISKKSIAAIGNFDGIHRGHQELLQSAKNEAKKRNLPFSIITFNPHPKVFFSKKTIKIKILDEIEKERLMTNLGVDYFYSLNFDEDLRNLDPENFIELILKKSLNIVQIWAGENFRFGKNRTGSLVDSNDIFKKFSIEPKICNLKRRENQETYSSQAIRESIKNSEFNKTEIFLGRPWAITGKVEYGNKNGRKIGFPTANVNIENIIEPIFGVYVTKTFIMTNDGKKFETSDKPSISNLGIRPTIGGSKTILETHLITDEEINLYGKRLYVELGKFLRPEKKFNSLDDLKLQIRKDVVKAKKIHALG